MRSFLNGAVTVVKYKKIFNLNNVLFAGKYLYANFISQFKFIQNKYTLKDYANLNSNYMQPPQLSFLSDD